MPGGLRSPAGAAGAAERPHSGAAERQAGGLRRAGAGAGAGGVRAGLQDGAQGGDLQQTNIKKANMPDSDR